MAEVSVVVPSYNHATFIERTLRSIFAQTIPVRKLLVIDDGSKDESVSVIERVLADSPFPADLVARENRGLSATLNEGFAATEGEYFAYIGSDDLWKSTFLAEQTHLLGQRPDSVLAFSHAYLIDEQDNIIDRTDSWTPFADGDVLPFLLRGQVFSSPGVLYRRSALERHSWNEASILEDYELYLKLSADGPFARNQKLLSGWRQHGHNVSKDHLKMVNEWIAAQDRVADKLPISSDELEQVQREMLFDAIPGLVRSGERSEAFRWFRENLSASRGLSHTLNVGLRLLVPSQLQRSVQARRRARATAEHGTFTI